MRRLEFGDVVLVTVTLVAVLSLVGNASVNRAALTALTSVLVGWPAVLLLVLTVRFIRHRDGRFALLTVSLAAAAGLSAWGAIAIASGT